MHAYKVRRSDAISIGVRTRVQLCADRGFATNEGTRCAARPWGYEPPVASGQRSRGARRVGIKWGWGGGGRGSHEEEYSDCKLKATILDVLARACLQAKRLTVCLQHAHKVRAVAGSVMEPLQVLLPLSCLRGCDHLVRDVNAHNLLRTSAAQVSRHIALATPDVKDGEACDVASSLKDVRPATRSVDERWCGSFREREREDYTARTCR